MNEVAIKGSKYTGSILRGLSTIAVITSNIRAFELFETCDLIYRQTSIISLPPKITRLRVTDLKSSGGRALSLVREVLVARG
jgi:hypothetical protein